MPLPSFGRFIGELCVIFSAGWTYKNDINSLGTKRRRSRPSRSLISLLVFRRTRHGHKVCSRLCNLINYVFLMTDKYIVYFY